MDETALYWCQPPNKTLTDVRRAGGKLKKERLTVALTANAAGTEQLPPLLINTALKPRDFTKFNFYPAKDDLGILWCVRGATRGRGGDAAAWAATQRALAPAAARAAPPFNHAAGTPTRTHG